MSSVQSRSECVYSKITWLSLAFQDRVLAYVLPFILTFLIALLKGSREISLSDFLLSDISRKTGRRQSRVNTRECAAAISGMVINLLDQRFVREMKTKFPS